MSPLYIFPAYIARGFCEKAVLQPRSSTLDIPGPSEARLVVDPLLRIGLTHILLAPVAVVILLVRPHANLLLLAVGALEFTPGEMVFLSGGHVRLTSFARMGWN
jgi:hypothetical protein